MTDTTENQGEGFRDVLMSLAAFVIIIAGMIASKPILVPILLSAFIAIICSPALFFLENRGVPRFLAFLIVIAVVIALLSGVGAILGTSINSFTGNLPKYQKQLNELTGSGINFAAKYNIHISQSQIAKNFDPGMALGFAGNILGNIGGLLSQMMLIFITVAFILFETSSFPRKLESMNLAQGEDSASANVFTGKIKRYLAIKTVTSFVTALLVTMGLLVAEVDYPYLWGMLAFFLNFIPSIGSILAAIPVLLMCIIQHGVERTIWVAVFYAVVNVGIGNLIEPRYMGKELGLSPLVVFLSLIFWGWVLGPVGMFLSVPLTMTAKIAFDSRKDTKWIGVLLGP